MKEQEVEVCGNPLVEQNRDEWGGLALGMAHAKLNL
jgi:hypothetical protein